MSKNPFLNAGLAALYIILIVSAIYYGSQFSKPEDNILIPITMLSLFVLSAAVMGFLFLSQPLQLCFDGAKREGVRLFLNTVLVFAGFTLLLAFGVFALLPVLG